MNLSIFQNLKNIFRSEWDLVDLLPVVRSQPEVQYLLEERKNGVLASKLFDHSANWFCHVSSWEEYWEARPSDLKNTIRRKLGRLKR